MGEITEMVLEGLLCEQCGQYMDDDLDCPHICTDCEKENNQDDLTGKIY